MSIVVDTLPARSAPDELLRRARGARRRRGRRRRPGRRRRRAPARARRHGRDLRRRSWSRTATSTTSAASPTSPRAPARRSTCRRASATLLERYPEFAPVGAPGRPYTPDHLLAAARRSRSPGISFECVAIPGHSPGHLAFHADGCLFCGDVLFAGSVGRTDLPGGDWDTLLASIRTLVDRYPARDGRLPRPRPGDDARRRARAQPVPRGAARVTRIEAPRGTHDVLPSEQPLWQKVTGEMERLCALYGYRRIQTPVFEDTDALRAHVRRGLGRRAEGDVHVRRPRRPLADAAAGGDGADLPRLRRARHAPRAAAGEALHDRADVPLRRAAARPLPRALAALARGDRLRRSGDRRRGDPALRHAARAPRRRRATSSSSTRSATATAGPRTSSS